MPDRRAGTEHHRPQGHHAAAGLGGRVELQRRLAGREVQDQPVPQGRRGHQRDRQGRRSGQPGQAGGGENCAAQEERAAAGRVAEGRRGQRRQQRPQAEGTHQDAVLLLRVAEDRLREGGEEGQRRPGEDAQQPREQQQSADLRRRPGQAEAFPDRLAARVRPAAAVGRDAVERDQNGNVTDRVEGEAADRAQERRPQAPGQPGRGRRVRQQERPAGQRRADGAGRVEQHRVEGHGVDEVFPRHQVRGERQPGRQVGRLQHAVEQLNRQQHPRRRQPRDGHAGQHQGRNQEAELRRHDEPALRQAVGEGAAPGAEQQRRADLRDEHEGGPERVGGQVVDEPHERGRLHPTAGERDDLAEEVAAVVGVPQGPESAVPQHAQERPAGPPPGEVGRGHRRGERLGFHRAATPSPDSQPPAAGHTATPSIY